MVDQKPLTHEILAAFHQALLSIAPSEAMEPALRERVFVRGILTVLQEDGSSEAVDLLIQAVLSCPIPSGAEYAFNALQSLSIAGSQAAIEGLFQLAIDHDNLAAQSLLLENQLESTLPELTATLHLLSGEINGQGIGLDQLNLLTGAFFSASEAVRQKMLSAADLFGLANWASIAASFSQPSERTLAPLVSGFASLQPAERALLRALLLEKAKAGSQVCGDKFCELFIQFEDLEVRQLAVHYHIFPQSPIQRALFLFLAEQWQEYQNHDFNHALIAAAYELGSPEVRKRILTISQESGFTGWLKDLHSGTTRSVRLLTDLTTRDWQTTLQALQEKGQWEHIWRLALAAPPVWGAKIIRALVKSAWSPEQPETSEFLRRLAVLAARCLERPIELVPSHTLPTGLEILNLAASFDESVLAAGTRDGDVSLWRKPLFTPLGSLQLGSVQGVRTLAVDQQGRYLAAASGDNRIRIFDLDQNKPIKTLEGHQSLVRSLAIHPDQRTLVSGSFDGTVRLWRFPLGPQQKLLKPGQGEIHDIAISPDGAFLLCAGFDQAISVYRLPDGSLVRRIEGHHSSINRLAISPQHPFIAAYEANGEIKIWNYESGRQIAGISLPKPDDILTCMALHPSENLLVSGNNSGELNFWQTTSGEALDWIKIQGTLQRVTGILFLEKDRELVTADSAGILKVFSMETLLLATRPVELHSPGMLKTIEQSLQTSGSNPSHKTWLAFTAELLRWRQRFDVELSAHTIINTGEFDIQL